MTITKKSHAKDYLLEHKVKNNTPKWLALLIQKVIDTNAKVSNDEKDAIFQELLKENGINTKQNAREITSEYITTQTETTNNSERQRVTLQKITHIEGVNALIPNQSINLSPTCTIIFGLNGTGKSGYFRIIHELAGGAESKSILSNIHKNSNGLIHDDSSIKVEVDFLLGDKEQNTFKWEDKASRGIAPFDQIKVFDSSYLPIFLNERESSVDIKPLGLHLFQEIPKIIDEFKARIDQTKEQKKNLCPGLQILINDIHSNKLKALLRQTSLIEQEKRQIDNNKIFSNSDITKIEKLKKDKDKLKNNPKDRESVLNQEKKEIDNLKEHLLKLENNLKELTKNTSLAVNGYLERKNDRDNRTKEFEVLKNIPSKDTEEWQAFIKSAKGYRESIGNLTLNKGETCIYCHQPLSGDALKIVQAYAQYLDDQSQQKFQNAVDTISKLEEGIKMLITDFTFSQNLNKILIDIHNEQKESLKILVKKVIGEAEKQKSALEKAIECKIKIPEKYALDLLGADDKLAEILENKQNELNGLRESNEQKVQKISEYEGEIRKLEDRKNISKWKTRIEHYFEIHQSIQAYESIKQKINSKGITRLGSKAYDELLTDSLKESFENQLKDLGKNIEVSLEKTSAEKGAVRTGIKILGKDIHNILSDGEQKVAGIALFLAEVESQNDKCPIVFDDPVTSIDHEIADSFAQKLLRLSSDRQIIIFTHNKLFYNSLVYWSSNIQDKNNNRTHHICKSYTRGNCNTKGFHVYTYNIDREAKDKTGKVSESQNECCSYYIKKAENEMKGNYALSSVASDLKSAIEHYIDEKVLLNISLLKDRPRKATILWEKIEKIDPEKENVVKELKSYWDNLSDRGSHSTQNSNENPLKIEDLNKIIQSLKK